MIPAMMKKTSVLFIDDEKDFIDDICDLLPKTHYFHKYTNPAAILPAITQQVIFVPDTNPGLSTIEFPIKRQNSLFTDVSRFPFEKIASVLVVDHRMEPIDGIKLCQSIKSRFTKKIMLTSYHTQDLAIKALNDGTIDMFLLKTDRHVIENLSDALMRCTKQFFLEISKSIEGYNNKMNPFNNPKVIDEFNQFCVKNEIIDYCFVHDLNQIIMKDINNNKRFLSVFTNDDLDDLLSTEQASTASLDTRNAIRAREKVPCSVQESSPMIAPGSHWNNLMVPLKTIEEGIFIAYA